MVATLRFFPEAWYAYASFELSTGDAAGGAGSLAEDATDAADDAVGTPPTAWARAGDVLRRALLAVPGATLLHLAFAELLEAGAGMGGGGVVSPAQAVASARAVFVALVRAMPSSAMAWALLERFERRSRGVEAARRVFRLTRRARLAGELGVPTYLAHALLEWHANGSPSVALKVLSYCLAKHPAQALISADFVLVAAECTLANAHLGGGGGGGGGGSGGGGGGGGCGGGDDNEDGENGDGASGGGGGGREGAVGRAVRDARSLFERSLAAISAAVQAYHAALPGGLAAAEAAAATGGALDWRGAVPNPGPKPVWLAYMRLEVLHAVSGRDGARLRDLERRMLASLPARDLAGGGGATTGGGVGGISADPSGGLGAGDEGALQRLWWRHAPPGLEPASCATPTDAAL